METFVRTGRPEFDALTPRVRGFLAADVLEVVVDGERLRGYRPPDARSIWIRDYSDMMRGFRHFEADLWSVIEHFAATQAASGRLFDYVTTFPEKPPCERENWTKYVRVPVEADVEFRFVKAAWLAWQASGDGERVRRLLPNLRRALDYSMSHPWRWDRGHGLVKRAYTIDTWDFAYTAGRHDWLQFQIDEGTYWGLFHGDNSGLYEALLLLARLEERCGAAGEAGRRREQAARLREALNRVCWNGRFYTHFVKLGPVEIPGVDEAAQLSLSNPMAVNRGAATHAMALAMIDEYRRRESESRAFAGWFSIDPPFPDGVFGDQKLVGGAYVNGGIMPLVGGELARAAFEHGREEYGVEILRRYHRLVQPRNESFLWYFPDGTPSSVETSTSPEAAPTDGWGSSAMLWALLEGLAGVQDQGCRYEQVRLAPRWPAAGVERAEVSVGYPASGAGFAYEFAAGEREIRLTVRTPGASVEAHVLLPEGRRATRVAAGGAVLPHTAVRVEASAYVDFALEVRGAASIEIELGHA